MTEEEAKTKWCPMVRLSDSGGTFNRDCCVGELVMRRTECVGSACMMFRAELTEDGLRLLDAGTLDWSKISTCYCGLAGKS